MSSIVIGLALVAAAGRRVAEQSTSEGRINCAKRERCGSFCGSGSLRLDNGFLEIGEHLLYSLRGFKQGRADQNRIVTHLDDLRDLFPLEAAFGYLDRRFRQL